MTTKLIEINSENKRKGKGDKGVRVTTNTPGVYSAFRGLVKLYGDSYEPIKKALFYSLVGNALKENMIIIGDFYLDTRIPLFTPMKSGHGKQEIENTIEKTITEIGKTYAQPTSYHSEQLVGKTVFRNDKAIPNLGYLSYDYIVIDEAIEPLEEHEYQDARDYLNKALDPIGQNKVTKKSVDVLEGEEVSYIPKCTVGLFFQPLMMPEKLVTRGLLRRGLIPYVEIDFDERMKALDEKLDNALEVSQSDERDKWTEWLTFLKNLVGEKFDWEFSQEAIDLIKEKVHKLIEYGISRGDKSYAYTVIMAFDLMNLLLKMSVIQAACNVRANVLPEDVENAYLDLRAFWELQLNYVTTKVRGRLDYRSHLSNKLMKCLSILDEKKCYSLEESCLSIGEYDLLIADTLEVSENSAKRTYRRKLKDMGYIDSKQVGSHDSRVWLTEKGYTVCHPTTLATL